jgi:hypothetical protein
MIIGGLVALPGVLRSSLCAAAVGVAAPFVPGACNELSQDRLLILSPLCDIMAVLPAPYRNNVRRDKRFRRLLI